MSEQALAGPAFLILTTHAWMTMSGCWDVLMIVMQSAGVGDGWRVLSPLGGF